MDYGTEYKFLFPPRPEQATPPSLIRHYEMAGYIAQVKKNGTCNVIAVSPNKEIICETRHNEPHKQWHPNSMEAFKKGNGWCVFVAELMNNKTKTVKNVNYINDILVYDGNYLVGTSFADRQRLLSNLFTPMDECYSHYVIDNTTWLAKNYTAGFRALYDSLEGDGDEGLVFKQPDAVLAPCSSVSANSKWLAKVRKATKNYGF